MPTIDVFTLRLSLKNEALSMFEELMTTRTILGQALKRRRGCRPLKLVLHGYKGALKTLRGLAIRHDCDGDDGDDSDECLEELSANTRARLQAVAAQLCADAQAAMKLNLEQSDYFIDDRALLTSITGLTSLRMEQVCPSHFAAHAQCN
jgi:hypothetical protein